MHVRGLRLRNYRNYVHQEVDLAAGVTVLVGRNGQGKTNLVEALAYLATAASHRVSTDVPLVRHGESQAVIGADVDQGGRHLRLDVTIMSKGRNVAAINGVKQSRYRDVCGNVRAVVFAPEDIGLVRGDPAVRRRLLDELLCQLSPRYAGVKSDYDRVLKQRNTLLRNAKQGGPAYDVRGQLAAWDEQFAALAVDVSVAREYACERLHPEVVASYQSLVGADHDVAVGYAPASQVQVGSGTQERRGQYVQRLAQLRDAELARGVTLVGPHRDDVMVGLRGLPAKGYASHGESWSLALALRLGIFALLRDEGVGTLAEREPIVVLDDVFAELDDRRRGRLVEATAGVEQLVITAAVVADVPAALDAKWFQVEAGAVSAMGAVA